MKPDIFDSYIADICSKIISNSDRNDAENELFDHILTHYEECIERGMSDEDAAKCVLDSFGDKELLRTSIADSYNKNRFLHKLLKCLFASAIIIVIVILVLVIAVFFDCYKTSSDVYKYESLLNSIDAYDSRVYDYTDQNKTVPVFPEKIKNKDEIVKFKYVYYNPWDPNYFWYLVVDYNSEDYSTEIKRLSDYNSCGLVSTFNNVKGAKEGYDILSYYAETGVLIYALSDSVKENRIIYVGFSFCNGFTDINYEFYIDNDYLLDGFTGENVYLPKINVRQHPPQLSINYTEIINPSYEWNYCDVYEEDFVSSGNDIDSDFTTVKSQYDENLGNYIFFNSGFSPQDCSDVNLYRLDSDFNIVENIKTDSDYLIVSDDRTVYKLICKWDNEYYNGSAEYIFIVEK